MMRIPGGRNRLPENVAALVLLVLLVGFGIDWLIVKFLDANPFFYCTAVFWGAKYGIGGSLALLFFFVGVVMLIFRRRFGFVLVAWGIAIKLLPSLLTAYLGFPVCGA